MSTLPDVPLRKVFENLELRALLNLGATCRRMYSLMRESICSKQLDAMLKGKDPGAVYKLVFNLDRQKLLTIRCEAQVDKRLLEVFKELVLTAFKEEYIIRSTPDYRDHLYELDEAKNIPDIIEAIVSGTLVVYSKLSVLNHIVELLAGTGDVKNVRDIFERALSVAEGIQRESDKPWALAKVAKSISKTGEFEKARDIFGRALSIAEEIPCDEAEKSSILAKIAKAVAETGEFEKARDIFDRARSAAEGISRERAKCGALGYIAKLVEENRCS